MYYKLKTNAVSIKTILENKDDYFLKLIDKDIDIKEEQKEEQKDTNQDKKDDNLGNDINKRTFREREIELMRNLYTDISQFLYPFVIEILDEYEFIGSPLYSPLGIDRETISQIVDKIIAIAEKTLDIIEEIRLNKTEDSMQNWDNWAILRTLVEVLVLNELFLIKRPDYFKNFVPILK